MPSDIASGAMDKQAISKACSDQANAKGLHGKARKKFRSKCKTTAARCNAGGEWPLAGRRMTKT
jgi:hypothetical protein